MFLLEDFENASVALADNPSHLETRSLHAHTHTHSHTYELPYSRLKTPMFVARISYAFMK